MGRDQTGRFVLGCRVILMEERRRLPPYGMARREVSRMGGTGTGEWSFIIEKLWGVDSPWALAITPLYSGTMGSDFPDWEMDP